MLRTLLICCLTLHGAFTLLLSDRCLAGEDPAGCVEEIGIAIDAADPDTFQELVDMDTALEKALDVIVAEASKPENAARLPPLAAMMIGQLASGGATGQGLRKMLLNEMKSFILHGIASGAFAGRPGGSSKFSGMLGPLFANASTGRKEIKNIGAPRAAGEDWLVPFVVHDYGNGHDYAVVGRLSPAGNGLRLTQIDNIIDLLIKIGDESLENGTVQ